MRPRSRLLARTGCLSSYFQSARRGRLKPFCAEEAAQPLSVLEIWTNRKAGYGERVDLKEFAMAAATHDLNELKRRMQGAIHLLKQELGGLRTGRASANLLEPVQVEAYGTHMPLNQVATVSVPEPRLISVQVWDKSMVHAVEKAIHASNLGLSPSTEVQVLRLRLPALNEERRKDLVKVAHKYTENAKVAVRD